ncbi:dTDP-4-dehydrorhamnose 3,5-epimerase [Candidatus Babeliales bacterium]|nr:dTDP-4-dehydrorhamnose 3,5-epimerase [Candidatus Babeliales bacterium]
MKFITLPLSGAFLIELEPHRDHRGYFERTWCKKEFETQGIVKPFVQTALSYNEQRGTLRGIHFQKKPHQEAKLISCIQGSAYDVIVDLRPTSVTFLQTFTAILSEEKHNAIYIPEGFAHGFQTLEDKTKLSYALTAYHHPDSASGIRWDDPTLSISWPIDTMIISKKDQDWDHVPRTTQSS